MFDDPGLSWSQLRAFDACVRFKSFGAAALRLSMSASAVRFQIGLLESRLEVTLFERQGGRLALTEIGRGFAADIARPMQGLLAACHAAQTAANDAPLTLTAPPLFAREFLLIEPFMTWCDAKKIQLDVSDSTRDLLSPGLIAAVRFGAEDTPDFSATKILNVELCIAAAPNIASSARPDDADWWAGQTLLTPSASQGGWVMARNTLKITESVSPKILSFTSYGAALESACHGSGLILAPLQLAKREMATGRLVQISNVRIPSVTGYSLIMRKEIAALPRGRALTRMLARMCRIAT
jgi:LysR family transcriptional regulator, glycine cleavage system transcriptional activator